MKAVLQEKSTFIHANVQWKNTFMVCLLQKKKLIEHQTVRSCILLSRSVRISGLQTCRPVYQARMLCPWLVSSYLEYSVCHVWTRKSFLTWGFSSSRRTPWERTMIYMSFAILLWYVFVEYTEHENVSRQGYQRLECWEIIRFTVLIIDSRISPVSLYMDANLSE